MNSHEQFSLAGELPNTSFQDVHRALMDLGIPIRVHHDIEFEWIEPDVDMNFHVGELRPERGVDYLITGSIVGDRAAALSRVESLARGFEKHGIVYRLELDVDAVDGENVLTVSHPRFSGYGSGGS